MTNQVFRPRKIAIVDDDSLLQVFLAAVVSKLGHESMSLLDGAAAVGALETAMVDLVILDMMMPGDGGVKVFHQLRGNPQTQPIPIIVYSGKRPEEVMEMLCRSLEVAALSNIRILQKPINPGRLMAEIEHVLALGVAGEAPPAEAFGVEEEERRWFVYRNEASDGILYNTSEVQGFVEYPNLWVYRAGLAEWMAPATLPEFG